MAAVYLNTRVSLCAARLWGPAEYDDLISATDAEVSAHLRKRGLPTLATGYGGDDPLSLEARLIAQLLAETRLLLRPLAGVARQFLLYWIGRFEVSNVKTLIRAKLAGEPAASMAPRLVDLGPFARLDANALMRAEDVNELLSRLQASPYADLVRHARQAFEDSHDPFVLDASLDRAYYEGLCRCARPLEETVGRSLEELMATLVDTVNLVWLLRYRFNYRLPPAQVFYLLAVTPYRLSGDSLRRLVTLPDLATVLAALPDSLRRVVAGADTIPGVAVRLEREGSRRSRALLEAAGHPLARAFAYLILRERNLRAVRGVLRGRHLRLPAADIRLAVAAAQAGVR